MKETNDIELKEFDETGNMENTENLEFETGNLAVDSIDDPSDSTLSKEDVAIEEENQTDENIVEQDLTEKVDEESESDIKFLIRHMKNILSFSSILTLVFATGIVCLGTLNTVSTKIQDENFAKGYGASPPMPFYHPFFQTLAMFIGEFMCISVFWSQICCSKIKNTCPKKKEGEQGASKKEKKWMNPVLLITASFLDLTGTTLTNFGLILTYASVYQMMRGLAIPANAVLSVLLLKSRRYPHHWLGVILILIGLFIVGLYSYLSSDSSDAKSPFFGALLVCCAQLLTASQYVVEEKLLQMYPDVNVFKLVGWEGFYGTTMCLMFLFVLYFIPGSDNGSFESVPFTLAQLYQNSQIFVFVVLGVFSIANFNICGINITKRVSSTSRATINSLRTISIWLVQLLRGKESFSFFQLSGFIVLLLGTFVYNEVVKLPIYKVWVERKRVRDQKKDERKKKEKEEKRKEKEKKKYLKIKEEDKNEEELPLEEHVVKEEQEEQVVIEVVEDLNNIEHHHHQKNTLGEDQPQHEISEDKKGEEDEIENNEGEEEQQQDEKIEDEQ